MAGNSRLFGGMNLGDIAQQSKDKGPVAPSETAVRPVVPAAELALTGRVAPPLERENIFSVDPKRCRPWRFHDRTSAWYTRERCADLIESIPKDGQQAPAVARRLTGDANFDYELISGMRRRFACEMLGQKLKLRVVAVDDAQAAVLMHIENADRQDITPMERALSFQGHLDAGLFASQDALAAAMNLSKGQVAKMLAAAAVVRLPGLNGLFPDKSQVPVAPAYLLSTKMERPGAKDVVLQRAGQLSRKGEGGSPGTVLKALLEALDASRKVEPKRKVYPIGTDLLVVARNAKGKVTLTLAKGVKDKAVTLEAIRKALEEL
jgi:ParB family transcriptional regulator, chromosome partitioning protein